MPAKSKKAKTETTAEAEEYDLVIRNVKVVRPNSKSPTVGTDIAIKGGKVHTCELQRGRERDTPKMTNVTCSDHESWQKDRGQD